MVGGGLVVGGGLDAGGGLVVDGGLTAAVGVGGSGLVVEAPLRRPCLDEAWGVERVEYRVSAREG